MAPPCLLQDNPSLKEDKEKEIHRKFNENFEMEFLHLYTDWKSSLGSLSAVPAIICTASYYLSINLLSCGLKVVGVLFAAIHIKKLFQPPFLMAGKILLISNGSLFMSLHSHDNTVLQCK